MGKLCDILYIQLCTMHDIGSLGGLTSNVTINVPPQMQEKICDWPGTTCTGTEVEQYRIIYILSACSNGLFKHAEAATAA